MNFKDLVNHVAEETGVPPVQVRKVAASVLEAFASLIESNGEFRSPIVRLSTKIIDARDAVDGRPARPQHTVATLSVVPQKP